MPITKLYRHGLTIGSPPSVKNRNPPLRSTVGGWSTGSCRRNTAFLRSVHEQQLTGAGVCVTLTLREAPPDAATFHAMRRAYAERLRRAGMLRLHWVIEWQRRGVPHIHGLGYFGPDRVLTDPGEWLEAVQGLPLHSWVEIGAPFGAAPQGQHFAPVTDPVGWIQYLAKHAARGVRHYQRSPENIPPAWRGKTGRVWGHMGSWPLRPPVALEMGRGCTWQLRRMARAWRIADARSKGDPRRIRSARRMLACPDRQLSECRGVSEWIPEDLGLRMLDHLHRQGHPIEDYAPELADSEA